MYRVGSMRRKIGFRDDDGAGDLIVGVDMAAGRQNAKDAGREVWTGI